MGGLTNVCDVTIAIPFYNDIQYLELAIRSVINQTYQGWILLLVDDGSSDGSLELAKKFASKDSRITVISDGENKKLPYRLNQIANLTVTPYLARMDADDVMHPERIEEQLEILRVNSDIDVLGSNVYTIDSKNKITGVRQSISRELADVDGFVHPSIMAKTQWFLRNPYDIQAARSQDSLLWASTKNFSNFKITKVPLLYYREVGGLYYKKYWRSSKSYFGILVNRKHKYKKRYLLMKLLDLTAKSIVYYIAAVLGKEKYLLRKRNKGLLKQDEFRQAERILLLATEAEK